MKDRQPDQTLVDLQEFLRGPRLASSEISEEPEDYRNGDRILKKFTAVSRTHGAPVQEFMFSRPDSVEKAITLITETNAKRG